MTKNELFKEIQRKRSFLCIGLDTDVRKIPQFLQDEDDPIFAFNKRIIDATAHLCVAYKPNLAFYESMGSFGIKAFEKTVAYLQSEYPEQFIIADAKRGDIGNTSDMYARSFFEHLKVDALTIAPYMGSDSVQPFLKYTGHWVILLALTSNEGAFDFQLTEDKEGKAGPREEQGVGRQRAADVRRRRYQGRHAGACACHRTRFLPPRTRRRIAER